MKMMDESERDQALPMVELNALRMEAMAIYERCLAESSGASFQRFLERALVQLPPPVALLNEISDDLFQRLQTLRQTEFDLRDRLITGLQADFAVELSAVLPLRDLDHLAQIQPLVLAAPLTALLSAVQFRAVVQSLEEARQSAARLAAQRHLTHILYDDVTTWATALHVIAVRGHWRSGHEPIVQNVWSLTL